MRITSTYVENTENGLIQNWTAEDHLHIRGEYKKLDKIHSWFIGSPPHTWRILYIIFTKIKKHRITSTYVENTPRQQLSDNLSRDHLHIRGEYRSFFSFLIT